jgi:hypothetical protein
VTLTPTRWRPAPSDPAEALIREARRFQHRRWWGRGALALVVALLVLAGLLFSSSHGGVPAHVRPTPFRPGLPPPTHVVSGPSLGAAITFALNGPSSLAVDGADDVYFTDGNRVYEANHASGQIEVVAGSGSLGFSGDGGPGPEASLNGPGAVAVARNGDIYFTDGNDRIRMVSATTGIITTVAGGARPGFGGNGGPAARARLDFVDAGNGESGALDNQLAVGPHGDLYIADTANFEVRRISAATGVITDVAGDGRNGTTGDGGPATRAAICAPEGVTVDAASDVFIVTGCDSIREVSAATGRISTVFRVRQVPAFADAGTPARPLDLGIGPDGRILAVEIAGSRLLAVDPTTDTLIDLAGNGEETPRSAGATAGDGGPATRATFGQIGPVAMDGQGNLFLLDNWDLNIREVDAANGLVMLIAGQIPQAPDQGRCC